MIELTRIDADGKGRLCIIDADKIEAIIEGNNCTHIQGTSDREYRVAEPRSVVARKVLEYRLAMIKYGVAFDIWANLKDEENRNSAEGNIDIVQMKLEELSGLSTEKGADK